MNVRHDRDARSDTTGQERSTPWPIPAAPAPPPPPGSGTSRGDSREFMDTRDEFLRREESWRARSDALRAQAIRTSDRLTLLRAVSIAANEAQSGSEALQVALPLICDYARFQWAHAWIVDGGQGGPAGPAVVWYPRLTAARARFRSASYQLDLRDDTGMLRTVRNLNRPEWVRDLPAALPGRASEAEAAGVRVAAAYPAQVDGNVVAVLEFFSDEEVQPPAEFDDTMVDIGRHVAELIERRRLQREYSEKLHEWHRGLASELHDDLGQELTGLTCLARALADRLGPRGGQDARDAAHLAMAAKRALEKTRVISRGLLPVGVEPQGLVVALRDLVNRVSHDSGLSVRFERSGSGFVQGRDAAWHLFRIAQEALTNAVRHSEAREVSLGLFTRGETVVLEIADDGKGLTDLELRQGGTGLRNMRYRAGLIDAGLVFAARPRGGTLVVCALQENLSGSRS